MKKKHKLIRNNVDEEEEDSELARRIPKNELICSSVVTFGLAYLLYISVVIDQRRLKRKEREEEKKNK